MHVANAETNRRTIGFVAANFCQWCPPDRHGLPAGNQIAIRQIGHRYAHTRGAVSTGFHDAIGPVDDAVCGGAGGDIIDHADAIAGQPEAIAVVTIVHQVGAQVGIDRALIVYGETAVDASDRNVALHGANFITGLGIESGALQAVGDIVDKIHV